ncbi:protein FAM241B isoform X2 [Ranitomeya variabilis]|uniref:protein FAM241B isoform X2 n=2 Tax=Ranitomeya variabilis TaxID=490064 RepID=UPI0040572022
MLNLGLAQFRRVPAEGSTEHSCVEQKASPASCEVCTGWRAAGSGKRRALSCLILLLLKKMVRILANGDIVQDDDPRIRANSQRSSTRQGFFNTGNAGAGPQQVPQDGARQEGRSPFTDINQQLVNMGFPRWNLGNQSAVNGSTGHWI